MTVLGMASDLFDGAGRGSFLLPPCPAVQRLPTRLDGLVLLEPAVHGDERGFFSETWRADAWAAHGVPDRVRPGQPLALAPGHAARRAFPDLAGPGQARPRGARQGLRRGRRPAPRLADVRRVGGASSSTTSATASCGSRSASGTASACSARRRTSSTSAPPTTTPATEAGIRFDDPDVGIEWPAGIELLCSERDRTAPTLAQVAEELPFRYAA